MNGYKRRHDDPTELVMMGPWEPPEHASVSFDRPPVVETALSIQFPELEGFGAVHFGLFYERVRDRFPIAEDHPRLDPVRETFPAPLVPSIPMLRLAQAPPVSRVWLREDGDGGRLLQLQPDRFAFNWRRSSGAYPSHANNCTELVEAFNLFSRFCVDVGIGRPTPTLCEIVYVNFLEPHEGESASQLLSSALGMSCLPSAGRLPEPETFAYNRVFVIGTRRGRLYAEAAIGSSANRTEVGILKMTARVLIDDACAALPEHLELAHRAVIDAFLGLTSEEVRRSRWGQKG